MHWILSKAHKIWQTSIEILSEDFDNNPTGFNWTYPYLIGSDRDGFILLSWWLSKKNNEGKRLTIPKKTNLICRNVWVPSLWVYVSLEHELTWQSGNKSSFVLEYSGKSILMKFQETVIYTRFLASRSRNPR
jgi:hypothetical protein